MNTEDLRGRRVYPRLELKSSSVGEAFYAASRFVPALATAVDFYERHVNNHNQNRIVDFVNAIKSDFEYLDGLIESRSLICDPEVFAATVQRAIEHVRRTTSIEKLWMLRNIVVNRGISAEFHQSEDEIILDIALNLSSIEAKILDFYSRVTSSTKSHPRQQFSPITQHFLDGIGISVTEAPVILSKALSEIPSNQYLVGSSIKSLMIKGLLHDTSYVDYNADPAAEYAPLTTLTDVGEVALNLIKCPLGLRRDES